MSIKMIALAAATVAATTTAASADNYFAFGDRLENSSTLELGTIRAAADGVVEIYDGRFGDLGALLGTEEVMAGANSDVRVNVGHGPDADVIAVLKVDGQIVAQQEYEVN
ncbi:hypothetical protein SAMN05444003_1836 [Cognatiyoonia sediminum]|uniref:Uncharacterized protein n=1 Tax=Cognatiyoonia sediminum TaxID=1508389 RepID=A0A1M5PSX7_9RHOB|nr:hypothetical protein [Cognatiyoonia sediminum]SHH05047.1 hypothetical protein SAMN05444003_1836 [Cognatiyoonia sediminum]